MANLTGRSIIGFHEGVEASERFYATNPATGQPLQTGFSPATADEVERAVQIASEAFAVYGRTSGKQRGAFLQELKDANPLGIWRMLDGHMTREPNAPRLVSQSR